MPRTPIQWLAEYDDGETLPQYDGERENLYADIDRQRLKTFSLRKDDRILFTVYFDPGCRLVYRRRVFLRSSGERFVFYLAGWQKIIGGENVQLIGVVAEDAEDVHLIGRWRDDHPVFESIQSIEGED